MKLSFQRILGANLIIILSLAFLFRLRDGALRPESHGFGFIFLLAAAIFIQFFANSLLGMIARTTEIKQNFFMAALLTLLIGFGACIGGSFTY